MPHTEEEIQNLQNHLKRYGGFKKEKSHGREVEDDYTMGHVTLKERSHDVIIEAELRDGGTATCSVHKSNPESFYAVAEAMISQDQSFYEATYGRVSSRSRKNLLEKMEPFLDEDHHMLEYLRSDFGEVIRRLE